MNTKVSAEEVTDATIAMFNAINQDLEGFYFDVPNEDIRVESVQNVVTMNNGIAVRFSNGQRFYLTIAEA